MILLQLLLPHEPWTRCSLSKSKPVTYLFHMSFAEIQEQALALDEQHRARLIASLLETISPNVHLSDDEVLQRDADLDSGRAEEISHQEFISRVEKNRRR